MIVGVGEGVFRVVEFDTANELRAAGGINRCFQ